MANLVLRDKKKRKINASFPYMKKKEKKSSQVLD
jgi:hypothetical protein